MIGRICKYGDVRRRPVLMGRGLDGLLRATRRDWLAVQFSGPRSGVVSTFSVAIARGKHLFPFRTEQLSLSAPMVLGPRGPGRVGRRRFFFRDAHVRGAVAPRTGQTHACSGGATAPGRRRRCERRGCRWGCGGVNGCPVGSPSRSSAKSSAPSTSLRSERVFGSVRAGERNMCSAR